MPLDRDAAHRDGARVPRGLSGRAGRSAGRSRCGAAGDLAGRRLVVVGCRGAAVARGAARGIRAVEVVEVVERVALEVEAAEPAMRYLRTKKERMGHLLSVA